MFVIKIPSSPNYVDLFQSSNRIGNISVTRSGAFRNDRVRILVIAAAIGPRDRCVIKTGCERRAAASIGLFIAVVAVLKSVRSD